MYAAYYLRFLDETECDTVLSSIGYRVCQIIPPPPTTSEEASEEPLVADNNGEPVSEPSEIERCWYTTGDQDGAVDIVGILYNDDAVIDPNTGEVITPPTPMPGWHVNIALDGVLPSALNSYIVLPQHPRRVFAGLG